MNNLIIFHLEFLSVILFIEFALKDIVPYGMNERKSDSKLKHCSETIISTLATRDALIATRVLRMPDVSF